MKKRVNIYTLLLVLVTCFSLGLKEVNAENVVHYFEVYKCPVQSDDYEYEARQCNIKYNRGELDSYAIANNGNLSLHGDAEGNYQNIILVVGKIDVRDNSIRSFNTTWNWDPQVLSIIPSTRNTDEHIYGSSSFDFQV